MSLNKHMAYYFMKMRALYLTLPLTILLCGCNLNSLINDCETLDKSISTQESEALAEHDILLNKMENMYFYLGFKDQLGIAAAGVIVSPSDELVQISNQYHETVEAINALGQDKCEKKRELSEMRISLLNAKLELQRKLLDERTMTIIEKTSDKSIR
jgi:hypothetical protein